MSQENNNNEDKDNKDKDNKDKENQSKKMRQRIMDRQGFYTILILCLIIVGATALWVDNQKGLRFIGEGPTGPFGDEGEPEITLVEDDDKDVGEAEETGKIGEGKSAVDKKAPVIDSKQKPKQSGNTLTKDSSSETAKNSSVETAKDGSAENVKELPADATDTEEYYETEETEGIPYLGDAEGDFAVETMAMPVAGNLMLPFADDHLVYHKTLDQWSTHKGIDIQAAEGTPVKAALDGEVVEVVNDTIMGISIVLRHDNELLTIYSNLSTDAMVEIGEQVKKGQTISAVGKTASVKTLEGPLLHFQVFKDDKFINPEPYLGIISQS